MKRRSLLSLAAVSSLAVGCSAAGWAKALGTLVDVAQGADYLENVIQVARTKADRYFDRHPNLEREREVGEAFEAALATLASLRHAIAAAKAAGDKHITLARDEALAAYEAFRKVLDAFGILDAVPPLGGAETDAPAPRPFVIPTRQEMEQLI